jgi:putative copper export protein
LLYWVCISLHLLAASLWLGHMFVWSLVVGPAQKRIEPPETAELLRERSLYMGGLGWPALAILVATGLYLLNARGISPGDLVSGAAFSAAGGSLAIKLGALLFMIVYQAIWAHGRAPIAIYCNILAALIVLGASVVLVRGWT